MCAACAPDYGDYRPPQSWADANIHGIGIIGPDGKHVAIQDFFAASETEKLP